MLSIEQGISDRGTSAKGVIQAAEEPDMQPSQDRQDYGDGIPMSVANLQAAQPANTYSANIWHKTGLSYDAVLSSISSELSAYNPDDYYDNFLSKLIESVHFRNILNLKNKVIKQSLISILQVKKLVRGSPGHVRGMKSSQWSRKLTAQWSTPLSLTSSETIWINKVSNLS